jgi:hypothetical protein
VYKLLRQRYYTNDEEGAENPKCKLKLKKGRHLPLKTAPSWHPKVPKSQDIGRMIVSDAAW